MEVATNVLEFLNLKLKFDKESKQISVDVRLLFILYAI